MSNKNHPLSIAHVIQTVAPRFGGPVTVLKAMAKEQARAGHRVNILTTNLDYPGGILTDKEADTLEGTSVEVKYFPSEIPFFSFSTRLATFFHREILNIDILHVWCLYRFPQFYSCLLARNKRLPYIMRPCGALEPFLYRQSKVGLPFKRIYEKLVEWPNLRKASAINCVTQQEAENMPPFVDRNKIFVLGNGIDWAGYRNLPERGVFRKRLPVPPETPLVLFLGRVNFKKGLNLLVPAFARVLESVPQARLAVAGPDNDGYGVKVKQWCQEMGIADKVFFAGHLGPDEVKQAFVDADVFVLPSYTENFGMTVVEAMACGCPVVISDQVNIWREVKEGGAGLVVGLDPVEIAEAVCRVLQDKEGAAEMSTRGRLAAEQRYSWPQIVDQLTDVYRKLIEDNTAKRRIRS